MKSLSSQQLTPDVKGNRGAGRLPRVLTQPSVDGEEDARSEGAGSDHLDGVTHLSKQAASAKKQEGSVKKQLATARKQSGGGRLNINRSRMQPGSSLVASSYQHLPQHKSSVVVSSVRASGNNYQRALNTYQAALPQLKLDSRPPWDDRNITNASSHGPGVSVLLASSEQPSFQAGGDASRRHQQQ